MAKLEIFHFVFPMPELETIRNDKCEVSRIYLNEQLDTLRSMRDSMFSEDYEKQYNDLWDKHAKIVRNAYACYYRALKRQNREPYNYFPDEFSF